MRIVLAFLFCIAISFCSAQNYNESKQTIKDFGLTLLDSANAVKKTEQFDKALELYNIALNYFNKKNDIQNVFRSYSGIIDCFGKKEDLKKAFYYASLQKELAEQTHNYSELAKAYITLYLNNLSGPTKKDGVEYLIQALNASEKSDNPEVKIKVISTLGGHYMENGQYNKSREVLKGILPTAYQYKDSSLIFSIYNLLGIVERKSGNFAEAANWLTKALELSILTDHTYNEMYARNNLSRLYRYSIPDSAKFFEHYTLGKQAAMKLKNMNMASRLDGLVAEYYFQHNEYEKCILICEEILNRSALFSDKQIERSIKELLYKVYNQIGDYKQALKYHVAFKADNDSLYNAEKEGKIKDVFAKYENEKKEKEIALLLQEKSSRDLYLLKKQNELNKVQALNTNQLQELQINKLTIANSKNELQKNQLEITNSKNELRLRKQEKVIQGSIILKQRNQLFVFVGVVIAGGLISFLIFNRYKLRKTIEKQQALINERKRISSELHDDLGAQLSTARMYIKNLKTSNSSNENYLIDYSLGIIDSSITDLRNIMDDLRVSTLTEKGYIAAVEELINKIKGIQPINFSLNHHQIISRFDKMQEHHLFRITQELINNTLKYAAAKNVSIEIVLRDEKICLMYEDDGKGCDLKQIIPGHGLKNIESRVKSFDGSIEFDSKPGNGLRANIEIPVLYGEKV
jgi:two-component system NarL family sensor kinase